MEHLIVEGCSNEDPTIDADGPQTMILGDITEVNTAELLAVMSLHENNPLFQSQLEEFHTWPEHVQVVFVRTLLKRMKHAQLSETADFLTPLLQRDFIARLPSPISEQILSNLDARGLASCETVSKAWQLSLAEGQLWKKLIDKKARNDLLWKGMMERRNWFRLLYTTAHRDLHSLATIAFEERVCFEDMMADRNIFYMTLHRFFRRLYPRVERELQRLETNWCNGTHTISRINCRSESSKGVYCLQYDDKKIVSGLRDNTIKIWNRGDLRLLAVLTGHTGSVLCLQYDEKMIVSGSSDATIRVWNVETGECVNSLLQHFEAVLHLRFNNATMVTCSKDRTVIVWTILSPTDINVRASLTGHRAAVNVVDFDDKFIVSASGDRTIKVWDTEKCTVVRSLNGHRRGIACLQYKHPLVVSGSSDNTIRLWDIARGVCLRVLEGHEELVRCLRFDDKRIVSGAYDGKIKIWDLKGALDPTTPPSALCLATLNQHNGRVFRLQFDEFQIVSSSHDDTIVIWNFLDERPLEDTDKQRSPSQPTAPAPLEWQIPQPAAPLLVEEIAQENDDDAFAGDLAAHDQLMG